MFQDPNHPAVQTLAEHHDAGTHDQIPADQAAAAVQAFHEQADPQMMDAVTNEHYDTMSPDQLRSAAQQFHDNLQSIASSSPEAAQLAQIDPNTATAAQVAAMHRFTLKNHPELMRNILIGAGATVAVGALAALAARHYLRTHGH